MFRIRPARMALLVAMLMACGCACRGERVGFLDRVRLRADSSCCCESAAPAIVGPGPPLVAGDVFPSSGCDACDGPVLGMPTGPGIPFEGIPSPGIYEEPLTIPPEPLLPTAPEIQELPPGEAQPLPADGMSGRRRLGNVTHDSKD